MANVSKKKKPPLPLCLVHKKKVRVAGWEMWDAAIDPAVAPEPRREVRPIEPRFNWDAYVGNYVENPERAEVNPERER